MATSTTGPVFLLLLGIAVIPALASVIYVPLKFQPARHPELVHVMTSGQENSSPVQKFYNAVSKIQKTRLSSFSWKNCGDPDKEIGILFNLTIAPDPVSLPGTVYISFYGTFKRTVDSPLKMVVLMQTLVGKSWIDLPCVGNIGSCTYDDACNLLAMIPECPPEFQEAGITCQCPFTVGKYALPLSSFDIDISLLPPGDYHVKADLTMNEESVGCYEVYITFS